MAEAQSNKLAQHFDIFCHCMWCK